LEVVFQLGQPDLHRRAADVRVGVDVLGERLGQRGGFADAGFHSAGSLGARHSFRAATWGRMRTLRNATGPWSPWSISGPVGTSRAFHWWPVGVFNSTSSWITCPFSTARTSRALAVFFPSASKRGARNVASSVCHSPGCLQALTRGGTPSSRYL